PLARGAWVGVTLRHRRGHLTRAILEGVAFGLKDSFELLNAAGLGDLDQVRVSGGGAKGALWRQILADVLGVELAMVNTTEGAAYGAAILGGVGASFWPDVETACDSLIKTLNVTAPGTKGSSIYRSLHDQYKALYPALKPSFTRLAQLEDEPRQE